LEVNILYDLLIF